MQHQQAVLLANRPVGELQTGDCGSLLLWCDASTHSSCRSPFAPRHPPSHHICLEVEDIQASAAHAARGARLLDPQPKPGAHGTPVVFLHPKAGGGAGELWWLEQRVRSML